MIDGAGRNITYLRLSVTDLCDLRCRYCMAEEGVEKRPHGALCSFEELQSFAAAAARLGVKKYASPAVSPWPAGASWICAPCCGPSPAWRSCA